MTPSNRHLKRDRGDRRAGAWAGRMLPVLLLIGVSLTPIRTTRAEIVVRVALLKQPRKPLSKRANVVRNILRASFKEL